MPTLGWILETAEEQFWEGQPCPEVVHVDPSPRPVFTCGRCGKNLSSLEALRYHLGLEHPLELPALYVRGKPLPGKSVLRTTVGQDDVQLVHCSRCEIQVDGSPWQALGVSEFQARFSQARNATWNIRLVHERPLDNSQSRMEYSVCFRIPDADDLNDVDEHFVRILARDELTHSDLEQYDARLPTNAPAREYGNALGNYALGVILKERRTALHAAVEFADFSSRMREALEVLHDFQRPVALAVSDCIRFNLNDFGNHGTVTATKLDAALRFFRHITCASDSTQSIKTNVLSHQTARSRPVCPIDRITELLLSACDRFIYHGKLSQGQLKRLQDCLGRSQVSTLDIAKIHVICAEGFLRLGRSSDARVHLCRIQFDPVFRDWAQSWLERI